MDGHDVKNGVLRYWQLGAVLAALAVSWGTLKSEVGHLSTAFAQSQEEAKNEEKDQDEVEKSIIALEITQKVIKDDVKEIKDEQKEQSEKLDKILEEIRKQ